MVQRQFPGTSEADTGRMDQALGPAPASQRQLRTDLQEALAVVTLRKWSILAVTVVMMGVALLVSAQQEPVYGSEAAVLVTPVELQRGTGPVSPNLATETELARSVAVAEIVVDDLELSAAPRALLGALDVGSPTDTEILKIGYRHGDPEMAQILAQGFAEAYLQYRRRTVTEAALASAEAIQEELRVLRQRLSDTEGELAGLDPDDPRRSALESDVVALRGLVLQRQLAQLDLPERSAVGSIVQPAGLQEDPVSPNHATNAGFGLFAGLALGIGLAFLRDRLAGRLRSDAEVEVELGAPVLAMIPRVSGWRKRKRAYLVTRSEWRSPSSESYRILRTNMLSAATAHGAKSILVTSAHTGEGKTATAANLAIVLARAGKRVAVVSADLRRPRLHEFFDTSPRFGLSDVLTGTSALEAALVPLRSAVGQPGADNLRLLSSGTIPDNPAEMLSSERMARLLGELESRADLVLIDAPPVLPVTDALVLAPMAGGVVLVIGPRSSTRTTVVGARQQIDRAGGNLLGAVLNGPDPAMTQTYYSY